MAGGTRDLFFIAAELGVSAAVALAPFRTTSAHGTVRCISAGRVVAE